MCYHNIDKRQVAGASFRGPLQMYILNLTLNEKLASHILQFASKYHVFLNSLWPQIREHTHRSSGPAKYRVFLDSLWGQIRDHTHRNLGQVAIYDTAVGFEKM